MAGKKYSSYAQIDNDLEIFKLEKEISYQKLVLSYQQAKDSITPQNIVSGFLEPYRIKIPDSLNSIIRVVFPYLLSLILKNKRG